MKKLVSIPMLVMMTMLFTIPVQAQERVKATLQHNDTLSVFTGSNAFKAAYEAAADGDTIFLSPGTFSLSSELYITKSITVQGSGCVFDQSRNLSETYLNTSGGLYLGRYYYRGGGEYVRLPCKGLTLEGIHISSIRNDYYAYNLAIRHCKIDNLNGYKESSTSFYFSTFSIEHCWIESFTLPSYYLKVNISNSYIGSLSAATNTSNSMSLLNCYINTTNNYGVFFYNNCIINSTTITKPSSYCTAYNCVVPEGLLSDVLDKEGNYEVSDVTSLFVDDYTSYDNFYKLTDEAAKTYLGQDGTQVGIYGGQRPYTPIPSYPRIVEKSIAGQTTTDGKLRVYVKAEARSK